MFYPLAAVQAPQNQRTSAHERAPWAAASFSSLAREARPAWGVAGQSGCAPGQGLIFDFKMIFSLTNGSEGSSNTLRVCHGWHFTPPRVSPVRLNKNTKNFND